MPDLSNLSRVVNEQVVDGLANYNTYVESFVVILGIPIIQMLNPL